MLKYPFFNIVEINLHTTGIYKIKISREKYYYSVTYVGHTLKVEHIEHVQSYLDIKSHVNGVTVQQNGYSVKFEKLKKQNCEIVKINFHFSKTYS